MGLALRAIAFTVVVPGAGGLLLPWLVLTASDPRPQPAAWPGAIVMAAGAALYLACLRLFAVVGRGTPGPWDAPRRLVTVGPYRWVRNPIYISALLVVAGEAWLFEATALVVYAAAVAIGVHLFVRYYEEPHLRQEFGAAYVEYLATVPRWIPRRPASG